MKSAPRTWVWTSTAFVGGLTLAMMAILVKGAGPNGIGVGLRLTARLSYIIFWLAYVGRALPVLFGHSFWFIGQRGRQLGLAFASAQLVHVGLVGWLAWLSRPESVADAVMPFFAIAIVWTYLLAALSTDYARRVMNPHILTAIFTIGSEYIALTFFADFILTPKYPIQYPILYVPFWIMLFVGPLLRLTAAVTKFSYRRISAAG
jgi:hypothetical protein